MMKRESQKAMSRDKRARPCFSKISLLITRDSRPRILKKRQRDSVSWSRYFRSIRGRRNGEIEYRAPTVSPRECRPKMPMLFTSSVFSSNRTIVSGSTSSA